MDQANLLRIFAKSTREGWSFLTPRGSLTVHDVWTLPITSPKSQYVTLDSIGRDLLAKRRELQAIETESLVPSSSVKSTNDTELANINDRIEMLRYIIDVRTQEKQERDAQSEKAVRLARLQEIKAKRLEGADEQLSDDELDKLIASCKA